MNGFTNIFQKLIYLWGFKAITMKFIERSIILSEGPRSKRWMDLRGRWPRGQSPSQAALEDKRGRALGAEKGSQSVVLLLRLS